MDGHRKLAVWRLSRRLVLLVYKVTRTLPSEEKFVVTAQLRRAAWSVQNNIAEGNAKFGRAERRRFFDIALGSLAELDSVFGTLPRLYRIEERTVTRIAELRRSITAALFAMLRDGR